jgi:NitT/TauT family transport system ATP-binding protein
MTMAVAPTQADFGIATAEALVKLRSVYKTYQSERGDILALENINLDIRQGEFLSLLGPSGCGKSTLLKMIAGLLRPTAGEISINGRRIDGPPDGVGMVFQGAVQLAWRNVLDNVMLQVEMRNLPREEYLPKARALLEMVGLKGFEKKYPWQLSGGMQQRASICRALVHDPAVLLMDEPFGALDAMTREKMNLELQRIWAETRKTVFFITHSIPEAVFLADRVLVMSERPGRIAAIYDIDLPRPRSLAQMGSPEFASLTQQIRGHFYSQGSLD